MNVTRTDLLYAETTLGRLSDEMAADAQANMSGWTRKQMESRSNDRAALIRARRVLLDKAENMTLGLKAI